MNFFTRASLFLLLLAFVGCEITQSESLEPDRMTFDSGVGPGMNPNNGACQDDGECLNGYYCDFGECVPKPSDDGFVAEAPTYIPSGPNDGTEPWLISSVCFDSNNRRFVDGVLDETLTVRLQVFVAQSSSGVRAATMTRINNDLAALNQAFSASRIQFVLEEVVNLAPNDDYFSIPYYLPGTTDLWSRMCANANDFARTDVVRLVYARRIYSSATETRILGFGGGCGAVMATNYEDRFSSVTRSWPGVLAQEIGHAFGLEHTFQCIEGNDCSTRGDQICDTPFDPGAQPHNCVTSRDGRGQSLQTDGTCTQAADCSVTCTDGSRPDGQNFMSYYRFECLQRFSTEQTNVLRCVLRNEKNRYVVSNPDCMVGDSRACTMCGIEECVTPGEWSGQCLNQGVCEKSETESCNTACGVQGTRSCTSQCSWGSCEAPSNACNGNGSCDVNAGCSCDTGYAGATCDTCANGYAGYPNCQQQNCIPNSTRCSNGILYTCSNDGLSESSMTCSSGFCQDATSCDGCANECTMAQRQCNSGQTAYRTCGNFDADMCLDWSNYTSCTGGQVCDPGTGSCVTPQQADVVARSVSCTPDPVTAGNTITCSVEIANQGTASSGTFSNRLYMSSNANISTQDTLLDTCSSNSIAAGASNTISCSGTVPAGTTGTRYFGVLVDTGNDVTESNETNNDNDQADTVVVEAPMAACMDDSRSNATSGAADPVSSGTSLSNLQICPNTSDWFRIDLNAGETLQVDVSFVDADGNINVRLYDSNTAMYVVRGITTTDDESVSYVAQATERHYIRIYGAPDPTSHSVDNGYSLQVTVSPAASPADVLVSSVDCTPEPVTAGTTISCSTVIQNQGGTASGGFSNRLYMSDNTNISTQDTLLDTCSSNSIAAGASNTISCSGTVPSGTTGTRYFGVLADTSNDVAESNESNNDNDESDTVLVEAPMAPCTASDFWTRVSGGTSNVVDGATGQFSLTAEFLTSSRTSPPGQARFRICKPMGETFSNDIHVRFRNGLTPHTNLMLFDGTISAAGNNCSDYAYFDAMELQNFSDGDRIGGNIRIVSPDSCNSNWGSTNMLCTTPPNPGCGTCFGRVTGGMLERTCRQ